ncbi:MAG: NUDIX domain-containing protein [Verrucomicrobia bacterium]|nr:NUDIX domain-containing protein [Verrucomicrobiota bacterium]
MSESVACILFEDSKILLIKRRDIPVWVLPGGGIDPGENPEQAACREMEEETGCKVEIIRKIAEYTPTNCLAKFTHYYEVKAVQGCLQTGAETLDFAFFSLDQLPKKLPPPYQSWIADAAARHSEMLRKPVEGVKYSVLLKLLILHPLLVGRFLLTKLGIHVNQ